MRAPRPVARLCWGPSSGLLIFIIIITIIFTIIIFTIHHHTHPLPSRVALYFPPIPFSCIPARCISLFFLVFFSHLSFSAVCSRSRFCASACLLAYSLASCQAFHALALVVVSAALAATVESQRGQQQQLQRCPSSLPLSSLRSTSLHFISLHLASLHLPPVLSLAALLHSLTRSFGSPGASQCASQCVWRGWWGGGCECVCVCRRSESRSVVMGMYCGHCCLRIDRNQSPLPLPLPAVSNHGNSNSNSIIIISIIISITNTTEQLSLSLSFLM